MTYLKLLTALTALALLTACAGGVAVNNTFNSGPTALTCTQNPFGTTCTAPTPTEAEAFCSDDNKPTTTKANDCAPTVIRVCGENPYDAGLCIDNNDYTTARQLIRLTCTNTDDNLRDELCPMAVATECTADPFLDVCRLGTAGVETGTYGLERTKQITETCPTNVHNEICHNVAPYEGQRQQILSNCETNVGTGNACPANVVMQVCLGNPYNTALCNDPAIDYTTQRMERLTACKGNNTLAGCADAAATTCPANPFQTGICFIGTTYEGDRTTQTQNCRANVPDAPNCPDAQTAACTLDKFDSICMGVALFIDAQIDGCADATATTAQCNALFDTLLAGCLQDPFSVACDTEATFTDSKVAVRTSRFGFCTSNASDARCAGYRTCNTSATFAPLTCGADFQSARVMFCKVPAQAFDAGCVDDLIDAEAQLAYCKLSTANLFGTDCKKDAFTQARIDFCEATPDTDDCRADARSEGLMSITDPCAGGACVDVADLPTLPTAPAEQATPTIDFADGALSVTLIAPTDGTLILNPNGNGAENTTIDPAPFNTGGTTGTVVREGSVTFRRRGGRGSSDDDGFVIFELAKANTDDSVIETDRASLHSAILPTTNLGAPLTDAPATAVWPGHYYTEVIVYPTDFYIMFEAGLENNQIGRIGLANLAKDGIGTIDADKPEFARGIFGARFAVTFDADGVLSGTIASGFFTNSVLGLIGTEGVVAVAATGGGTAGFTATNPDGGATAIVIDPCIAGLAACYGTHDFWRSNARNSNNTTALTIKPAGTADKDIDDTGAYFIAGGADTAALKNFNPASNDPPTEAKLTLSNLEGSNDANSGFSAVQVFQGSSYVYTGLLSDTDVGAPFTNANQPAAEWTAIAQSSNSPPSEPFTLDVVFTGGAGTIKTKEGETITLGNFQSMTINGQFGSNGVIYGSVVFSDSNSFISNNNGTLSGLIGVDGAVGVFISTSGISYGGGFVARPNP